MLRGMKIALDLTNEQEQQMWKSAGVARWSYNYAITRDREHYSNYLEDNTLPKSLTEGQNGCKTYIFRSGRASERKVAERNVAWTT